MGWVRGGDGAPLVGVAVPLLFDNRSGSELWRGGVGGPNVIHNINIVNNASNTKPTTPTLQP